MHQLEKLVKIVDGRSSTRARWLAGALHWPHTPHAALAAQSLEHGALGTPHRSPRPAAKPPVSPRTPLQSPRGAAAAAAAAAAASDQANAFHYDEELVEERLEGLHQLRAAAQERARAAQAQAGKPQARAAREEARNAALHLFEGLRADVVGGPNCGHMAAREVHRHGLRTPAPIKGFVGEVKKGIAALVALTSPPVAEVRGRAAEGERERDDSPTSALDLGALLESTDLSPRRVPPPAKGLRLKDRLLRRKDSGNPLSHMEGMKALLELERAHGKAALVLSGGGSFGAFHLGVVRKLHERNVLPRVVAGSSSGALIGAIVCTRTPSELALTLHRDYLEENARGYFGNGPLKMLASFLRKGYLQDVAHFQGWLMDLFGPMTFQEAYERSGRSLSICVSQAHSKEPPRLLNHVTAPHVLVWSAVACSCAFPCLFPAQELFVKAPDGRIMEQSQMIRRTASSKWRDGCLTENLPLQGLQELFNVNFVLASQANLFLSAWLSTKNTVIGEMSEASLMLDMAEKEVKHSFGELEHVLKFLPIPKWMLGWTRSVTSTWEGNLTVVRPSSLFQSLFEAYPATTNLSRGHFHGLLDQGEAATGDRIDGIQCMLGIENEILKGIVWLSSRPKVAPKRGSAREGPKPAGLEPAGALPDIDAPVSLAPLRA